MQRRSLPAVAAALGACVLMAGCGSGTQTVSQSGAPPAPAATQTAQTATTAPASTASTPTASTPAQTVTAGGTAAPSGTRTAPEPAFTEHPSSSAEGAEAAAAVLRSKGYTPDDLSEYHAGQTLRVLVGTRAGSSDGYGQQAFFFLDGRYLGTDAKEPSATVRVLSQSDTAITLAYPLYRARDPLSDPSGGTAVVRFELDDGQLTPVGTIPPASSATGLSRN